MKSKYLLIILILATSCWHVGIHTDDSVDLGEGYYYLPDGKRSTILLNMSENGNPKIGQEIIPPNVILYNSSNEYIIALSVDRETSNRMYWIIDKKNKAESPISFDSLQFINYLEKNGINLRFKE